MIKCVESLLLIGFIAVTFVCLPSRLFPSLVFKGRKRDYGEPYYDLDGREWKIYRVPTETDVGGAASGDPGGGGAHCGGDGGGGH